MSKSKHHKDRKHKIKGRISPKLLVVNGTTQTKDVLDAETNTKLAHCSIIESQRSRIKCTTASWIKTATLASQSTVLGLARWLRQDSHSKRKSAIDTVKALPDVKRRRGILKKVVEDLTLEGMRSTGTAMEKKEPTLDRILRENHIFLKYSKNCKTKKKRVRMDKKPALSYFNKRDQESLQSEVSSKDSRQLLQAAAAERSKHVGFGDDDGYLSNASEEDPSLERKPARLALRAFSKAARRKSNPALDALDAASGSSGAYSVSNTTSVRMDKKPALSYFNKRDQESLQSEITSKDSRQLLQAVAAVRSHHVGFADDDGYSSEASEEDTSLERKPARLALRPSSKAARRNSNPALDALDAASDSSVAYSVSNTTNTSKLKEKDSRHPLQRQVPQLSVCVEGSHKSLKRPPCPVPKDRLYFKNMLNLPIVLMGMRMR